MLVGPPAAEAVQAQDMAQACPLARDELIAPSAARFGLPIGWIDAVMGVESACDPRAVSRAGALGLMQLMPKTYAELRARYGLGPDPFHPGDNVMAGTAYLRELFDRFGAPGFLAAYNAGPERYLRHVVEGRPLPRETRRYLERLAPRVMGPLTADSTGQALVPPSVFVRLRADPAELAPPQPSLFVALGSAGDAP